MTDIPAPSDWLVEHAAILPSHGLALDVACGRGRHARWLAGRGLHVHAVDLNADAVRELHAAARAQQLPIQAEVMDLETPGVALAPGRYDVVVCVHYLHRPLFTVLIEALRPNGLLIYETFTRAQAKRGKPTNPAFLLEPGELVSLTASLTLLDQREGEFGRRDVASVVCRRSDATS